MINLKNLKERLLRNRSPKQVRLMVIGGLAAAVVIGAVVTGLGGGTRAEVAEISIAVGTKTVAPETIESYISVSSKLAAENAVDVLPKVGGTVRKVSVQVGDAVKAGDVLFEVDDTTQRLQAQQAAAQLASAQAGYAMNVESSLENQLLQLESSIAAYEIQYRDLQRDYTNTQTLFEAGAASKQELDTVRSSFDKVGLQLDAAKKNLNLLKGTTAGSTRKAAQATLDQARASLESAETQLGYTKVKAEIDGIVSAVNVTEGMTVSQQLKAVTLVNMAGLKAAFSLSDDQVVSVSPGDRAYVTAGAAGERAYDATVISVAPAADSTTNLYPVEIRLDTVSDALKPGMFASVRLVRESRQNALVLPINAVIEKGEERYVYTLGSDGKAHRQEVTTGISNETDREILSGLKAGDTVIIKGQSFVKDGDSVTVQQDH